MSKGLYAKYNVFKVEDNSIVNDCFVLRPDKDPAAVEALRAYASATENKHLAADILAWIGAPQPLTLEELLEMSEERVYVQFPGIGMYGLVAYRIEEDVSGGADVYITNCLGGRSTYDEIVEQGGVIYRTKPEGSAE